MIIAQIKDVFKSAQVSLLYKLAPQIPGHVVDIYMDFHSGADDDRRGLHRLHEDCRSGKIDTVYTKSVSRMARNTVDLLNILRELRAINVRIIFELESLDTANYETEFLITIIEAYAQEESYHRSENTRWGLEKRIKDGTSGLYRRKCFGYTKSEDGALVICPKEAVVVRLIYDLCNTLCFHGSCSTGDALRNTQRYDLLQGQFSSFQQFFSHHIHA